MNYCNSFVKFGSWRVCQALIAEIMRLSLACLLRRVCDAKLYYLVDKNVCIKMASAR